MNRNMNAKTTIQVSVQQRNELELLRIAWKLTTLADVIGKLTKEHRLEELGALCATNPINVISNNISKENNNQP